MYCFLIRKYRLCFVECFSLVFTSAVSKRFIIQMTENRRKTDIDALRCRNVQFLNMVSDVGLFRVEFIFSLCLLTSLAQRARAFWALLSI